MVTKEPLFPDCSDLLSKYGAGLIVDHIVAYWRARGFYGIKAERYAIDSNNWGVHSNMVAGIPPRRVQRNEYVRGTIKVGG